MSRKIKRDKETRIDPEKMLSERVAEGLTLGPESKEEADEKFPPLPGQPDLSYLSRSGGVKFRAIEQTENPFYLRFPDGRKFRDVDIAFTADDRERIRQGYMCLRCMEPQPSAYADEHIEGCIGVDQFGEHYMRDHMAVEVRAEFDEREVHVGPNRPLKAYLAEQEERKLRREFDAKKQG